MFNVMFKNFPVDTAFTAQSAVNRLARERYDSPEECRDPKDWTIEEAGMPRPDLTKKIL